MTVLESKQQRDQRGIDCFERAIVYGLLLLYKTVKNQGPENNPFFDAVQFNLPNVNNSEATLRGEVIFPIDRIEAVELGGNYLETIQSYGTTDPNPIILGCDASDSRFIPIVKEPAEVDTLEKYLAWVVNTIKANLVDNSPDKANAVSTVFFNDNPTFPRVRIQVQMPIDYYAYLRNNNLLCSVAPLLEVAVQPFIIGGSSAGFMNNTTLMNNEFLMGNGGGIASTSMNNSVNMNNNTRMSN